MSAEHPKIASTARTYLQWEFASAAAIQAYWLLTMTFWVVSTDLTPTELILLGTVLEGTVLISEIPTGVVADALSRKWSVVISMFVMGGGFFATGFVTEFWPIALTQIAWAVGWTFSSGADVAWCTDELLFHGASQGRVDRAIAAKSRWGQIGAALGLIGGGLLAWATSLPTVISLAGLLMMAVGVFVAVRFEEHGFTRAEEGHFEEARRILRVGLKLARVNRTILLVLIVTVVFNFGAEAVDRLTTKRLVDLGVPAGAEEIAWFTLFGGVGLLLGALALVWVERRIEGEGAPRALYAGATMVAAVGAILIALAPNFGTAITGDIVVRGLAWATLPVIGEVWVNRQAPSEVRATVQSFLGQAESVGEIVGGIGMAIIAAQFGIRGALTLSAILFVLTGVLVLRSRAGRVAA